ncbi:MAG: hypothetical protein HYU29_05990 [Chloroflexi bacterium]|nr:hypothetical protein [Chloroflexota bacterium]
MWSVVNTRKSLLVALMVLSLAALTACGVSKGEYDSVKKQLGEEQQQVSAKAAEVANLQQRLTTAEQQGTAAQQQIAAKDQDVKNLQQQVSQLQQQTVPGKSVIMAIVTPTPRPTATPGPSPTPGPTATPKPIPAARVVPIAFYADTATASVSKYNIAATASCTRTSLFKRGLKLLWRAEIVDTSSGKVLQTAAVKTFVVKLPSGEVIAMKFGAHGSGENIRAFWTTSWDIPLDYPLGILDYTMEVVTVDGKTGTFRENTGLGTSGVLTIVE